MKLLLDTHVVLWGLDGDPRLGAKARQLMEDEQIDVMVSAASLWEIAIKHGSGKLAASAALVATWLEALGIRIVPLATPHLTVLEALPWLHRDPFDRMIVAQTLVEGATLLTSDRAVQLYAVPQMTA